jgi:hypothetical protein
VALRLETEAFLVGVVDDPPVEVRDVGGWLGHMQQSHRGAGSAGEIAQRGQEGVGGHARRDRDENSLGH